MIWVLTCQLKARLCVSSSVKTKENHLLLNASWDAVWYVTMHVESAFGLHSNCVYIYISHTKEIFNKVIYFHFLLPVADNRCPFKYGGSYSKLGLIFNLNFRILRVLFLLHHPSDTANWLNEQIILVRPTNNESIFLSNFYVQKYVRT